MINAVQSFYLAKRTRQYFSNLPEDDDRPGRVMADIERRLMRQAVLDIAGLNDGGLANKDPGNSRTASLPTAHGRMKQRLVSAQAPSADLTRLEALRADIDADHHMPLKYVRHLRNKWAGHPSLDRHFDTWAETDKTLYVPVVEAALVRLVNNASDTAEFVSLVPALQDFDQPSAAPSADGSMPLEIRLSSVLVWAAMMRHSAGENIRSLRAQLTGSTMLDRLANTEAYKGERY
ncbi:hypothetical protein ACOCJ4_07870 [Knoellia sp. CPCC 206435]|uniref:hypothetical protein n=1 Tax=Knoellia terrae TaxID=3404797 RepID=UPI003B43A2BB